MKPYPDPLDLKKIKVYPLAQRQSLSSIEKLLVDPEKAPPPCSDEVASAIGECVDAITAAGKREASVILMYGAHLIKNGGLQIVNSLMEKGWLTHLATNGAGAIHDWELSYLGRTEESVRKNVATGTFGTWEETGRCIHLAILAGALENDGYGRSLGRFIWEEGVTLPSTDSLEKLVRDDPAHPRLPARAELLRAMLAHKLPDATAAAYFRSDLYRKGREMADKWGAWCSKQPRETID